MNLASIAFAAALVAAAGLTSAADRSAFRTPKTASLPAPATSGPLRILLVDDDFSENNHNPRDSRVSESDRVFRKLVADAVGGDANAWSIEAVQPYGSLAGIDRLRPYSLIIWYTGSIYGGNPDNTGVLSIADEKIVRQYLEQVGGAVILFSPGYLSKVQGASGTWEKIDWPFLKEVLGIRGGIGLAQRFLPGTVTAASGGVQFNVGKGGAVESQFSLINPQGAKVVFTTVPSAAKPGSAPAPVATVHAYGKGRIVYVGITFENLVASDQAPAFEALLNAAGARGAGRSVAAAPAPTIHSPEAAPAAVQVSGTPTTAVVSWTLQTQTVTNASLGVPQQSSSMRKTPPKPAATQLPGAKVERLVPNANPVQVAVVSPDAQQANDPGPLTPGDAVTYRVTLTDAQGRTGIKEASFTPPAARDPGSLSAVVQSDGSVILTWPEVPGVATYQVTGTALDAPVTVRRATEWRSPGRAPGPQQWKVASVYEPGGVLTAPGAWASARTRVVPTPGQLFLTLPSGPGSTAATEAYSRTFCLDPFAELSACSAAQFIRDATNWEQVWEHERRSHYRAAPLPRQWATATFADPLDLGVGRRVNCAPRKNGVTVCWASSHFPTPRGSSSGELWPKVRPPESAPASGAAEDAPRDFRFLAADANDFHDPKSFNIIVMSDTKAFFGAWKLDGPVRNHISGYSSTPPESILDAEHIYATRALLHTATALDTQGRKGVPHACLSCHGGTYNPATKEVTGSSLLPLVPARLVFAHSPGRGGAEESIRRINEIVLQSNPAPAIVDQVQALYNGTPSTPGTTANDAAVPAGWTQQAGLYRQVIAPYCASCHFAQRGPMNFRSWGNLLQNKDAVQRTVCRDFTMPHSEILFHKFWTEGGAVSLPGVLSSALGFSKCPQ